MLEIPAGYKAEERDYYLSWDGLWEDTKNEIDSIVEDWIEPRLCQGWDDVLLLTGYRPMTDRELEQDKKKKERAKEAAKRKKERLEAEERSAYERLKKKFGDK